MKRKALNKRYEKQWVIAFTLDFDKVLQTFSHSLSTKSTLSKLILIKVIYKNIFFPFLFLSLSASL